MTGTVAEGGAGSGAEMRYVQCILPEGVEAAEAADDAEAADGADGADGTVGGVEAAPTVYHGTTGSLDLELAYISLSRAHCVLPKAVVPAPGSKVTFALARERLSGRRAARYLTPLTPPPLYTP